MQLQDWAGVAARGGLDQSWLCVKVSRGEHLSKVIITCAVTDSIHTPSISLNLPVTPEEISDAAIDAAEAGVAIVHLHSRDPKTGAPDQSVDAYSRILPTIKQRTDVVLNITTGGAATMAIEERLVPATHYKPEVASLNMGSMNFGLFPMLGRFKQFKHDWEHPYLEGSGSHARFSD